MGPDLAAVATAAAGRALPDDLAAALGGALGAEPARLGPDAIEVPLAGPVDPAPLRARFPVDLNVVPAAGRRKRLLIADMDSTIIPVECIDLIAARAGVGDAVAAVTERAMRGELAFEDSLRQRVARLEGLQADALEAIWLSEISLSPGARTLVRTMAAHGAHTALVSGGFSFFTDRVGRAAGFAETRANRLVIADGRLAGIVEEPVLGREAKAEALAEMLAARGLAPDEALAVGDGANDLTMLARAGLGVAWRAKPAVAAGADAVIERSDLTAILYLQGYRAESFVRDDG